MADKPQAAGGRGRERQKTQKPQSPSYRDPKPGQQKPNG